jgi:hypothetical protein
MSESVRLASKVARVWLDQHHSWRRLRRFFSWALGLADDRDLFFQDCSNRV